MSLVAVEPASDETTVGPEPGYSTTRLIGGLVGRVALWLAAGCLVATLLPLGLGWRPFVVRSGSMEPSISVGDVIVASPNHDPHVLLGHVAVFQDPAAPGQYKSHRVVRVESDGRLRTKGDANPTIDSSPVSLDAVAGLGRLLVPRAGLPLVWLRTGDWTPLALLLVGLVGATCLVARDQEDDEPGPGRRAGPLAIVATVGAAALLIPTAGASFSARSISTAATWTASSQRYTSVVNGLGPYLSWQLGDAGATAADSSGNARLGTYAGGITHGVAGATPDDTVNLAATQTNSTSCVNTTAAATIPAPSTLSEVVWFRTTPANTRGGKLIGFENPRTGIGLAGIGSVFDRMIYLDGAGKVWFGVDTGGLLGLGGLVGVSSPAAYDDGAWHMAVATLGPAGMALYVDGRAVATDSNTVAQSATGFWRVGCGNLAGWGALWTGPNNPDANLINLGYNAYFTGSLDEAAVFAGRVLTPTDVAQLYFAR